MGKGERRGERPLTYFEIFFLMGMIIFSQKEIDYCILETGLGGRLDANSTFRSSTFHNYFHQL